MVHVRKEAEADALSQPVAQPRLGTGRRMAGLVIVEPTRIAESTALSRWPEMACACVNRLPPKAARPHRREPAPPVTRREQIRLRDTASGDAIHADGASTLHRAQTVCPDDRADIDPLRQLLFDREVRISASRNDRKTHRGAAEPAALVCGIRCSTGGTPPSVRMARYFAPFFRCCRTSREAALSYQLLAASLEGNSYTVTPCTGPCPSKIRNRPWSIKTRAL
jgi:hypothetical protein